MGFDLSWNEMGAGLFVITFLSILLARFCNVFFMSFVANWLRSTNKITRN